MRKGFTLIELLAVIVILAIIALIATPIIINIINEASENSNVISFKNLERAAELYYVSKNTADNIAFECEKGVCKSGEEILDINGVAPSQGKILIDKEGNITYDELILNGYNCYKEHNKHICSKDKARKVFTENSIVLNISKESNILDYNIYGNSVQDGESTPEAPIELESVGDKTRNLININGNILEFNAFASHILTNEELEENDIFIGITQNGYVGYSDNMSYEVNDSVVDFSIHSGAYGIGFKINNITQTGTYYVSFKNNFTERCAVLKILDGELTIIKEIYGTGTFDIDDVNAYYVMLIRPDAGTFTFEDLQIEYSETTNYEPYGYKIPVNVSNGIEEITTNIYLNEPLRKIDDSTDYVDFKNRKVVRYIEKLEDGTLKVLGTPKEEYIKLPEILLNKGVNYISVETSVSPSKIELEYYK